MMATKIKTKKGLFWNQRSKFLSRFTENLSSSPCVWLGDLYKEIKLLSLSPIFISKLGNKLVIKILVNNEY